MNNVFLLTGGNLGDRLQNLEAAAMQIAKKAGAIISKSSIYETAAWGNTNQQAFLNQVLQISTLLKPVELLHKLLQIEQELGRKRLEKMGPRTIDIDILFYNSEIIATPELTVPHAEIANRRFVLTPLAEVAGEFVHPVLHKTVKELLEGCPDELEVIKL